jgi:hypothetical protein
MGARHRLSGLTVERLKWKYMLPIVGCGWRAPPDTMGQQATAADVLRVIPP